MFQALLRLLGAIRFPNNWQGQAMTLKHHRQNDGSHRVEIHALKVLLIQEGDHWIAQGLDLDFAAAGESVADVKRRFSEGLGHTIGAHLAKNDSLDALIRPAPPEVWQMYFRLQRSLETTVQDLPESYGGGPVSTFRKLAFLQPSEAATA